MADAGIKRVTVGQGNLPPVTISNERMLYFLRYRITTEDKNRQSHWSPIYRIIAPPIREKLLGYTEQQLKSFVIIQADSLIVRVDWTLPEEINTLKEFDVYYKIDNSEFIFGGTVSANSYSVVVPVNQSIDVFEVAIQIPTFPKIRFDDATIFTKSTNDPVV